MSQQQTLQAIRDLFRQLDGTMLADRAYLRRDLRIGSQFGNEGIVKGTQGYKASIEDADYAVIQYRESGFSPAILNWMNSRKPLQELDYINVPLMAIYAR